MVVLRSLKRHQRVPIIPIILVAFLLGNASAYLLIHDTPITDTALASGTQREAVTLAMPKDRISEAQIRVYPSHVRIELENAEWSRFTDTGSMRPFLDQGANAIQIPPTKPEDLIVGDIISYRSAHYPGTIIHRIVHIDEDKHGWYAIAHGDNNPTPDPEKIRFSQIERVLVAIIY